MLIVDRRLMILEAAKQSFSQYGYKATSMEMIAKIANVGKGTIYTFFKTKDELFDEIVKNALNEMTFIIESGIKKEDTFLQNLLRSLDSLIDFGVKYELFAKLRQEGQDIGTAKAMEGLTKLENLGIDYLQREIDKAVVKGEVKPCNSAIVAFLVLKMYISLINEWRQSHEPIDSEQIKEYISSMLFKGLL